MPPVTKMVSVPLPAGQPPHALSVLAAWIASRREHVASVLPANSSTVVLTVMSAADALALNVSAAKPTQSASRVPLSLGVSRIVGGLPPPPEEGSGDVRHSPRVATAIRYSTWQLKLPSS